MEEIIYEKFEDYYVFSNNPNTRVYLGKESPEDYIWDELEQQKRTASSWYKEVHTGKEITFKDVLAYDRDGSKPGNGQVWYDGDDEDDGFGRKKESYTFEGGHTYDFTRKLHLASMGSSAKSCKYVSDDKAAQRLAWAWYFNKTLEKYDIDQKEIEDKREEAARKNPHLHNLMWVSGEMYYVDDNQNRISLEEHEKNMKAKFGDDVFYKAEK